MGGSFSDTVLKRLPSVIQALDPLEQQVYIYLRLRKTEDNISHLLTLPIEDVRQKAQRIRDALMRSGQLHLVQSPVFLSIHSDASGVFLHTIPSHDASMDTKLILKELLSNLRKTIEQLPSDQARLLSLRYNHRMSAREIVSFCENLGTSLISGKNVGELNEQDVFYALNSALKAVLRGLRGCYSNTSLCPKGLKYILEEIEI